MLSTDYKIKQLWENWDDPKLCRGLLKTVHDPVAQRWLIFIFWSIYLYFLSFHPFLFLCVSVITAHTHFHIVFFSWDHMISIFLGHLAGLVSRACDS